MWFATYDGLNKFDGYDFTVYQHDEQNPHSIGNDVIRTCIVDSQGRLWIGTGKGLSLYDTEKDHFHNFYYQKEGKKLPVSSIVEINEKQLLLFSSKEEGLLLFDTETQQFNDTPLHASLTSIKPSSINRQGEDIYIFIL